MLSCFWTILYVRLAVEQCHEVCRRRGTFLVDVNDWNCEFRDKLRARGSDGTTVACSSGGTTREFMSNESCLLDLLAAARNGNGNLQRKTNGKCVRQHKRGILGAVGHCEEFDPVLVHRAKMEEKDFIDKMGVHDVVPRSAAAEKWCRVIRTRWVTVNKGPMTLLSYVPGGLLFRGRCGDKHEYFLETPDLALVKPVIAHAARRAEGEDIVVAVFDVRRAYSTLKRRQTPLLSCRTMYLPYSGQRMLGSCARRCTELPSCSIVGR